VVPLALSHIGQIAVDRSEASYEEPLGSPKLARVMSRGSGLTDSRVLPAVKSFAGGNRARERQSLAIKTKLNNLTLDRAALTHRGMPKSGVHRSLARHVIPIGFDSRTPCVGACRPACRPRIARWTPGIGENDGVTNFKNNAVYHVRTSALHVGPKWRFP
jgi:hypothetical protein